MTDGSSLDLSLCFTLTPFSQAAHGRSCVEKIKQERKLGVGTWSYIMAIASAKIATLPETGFPKHCPKQLGLSETVGVGTWSYILAIASAKIATLPETGRPKQLRKQ